MEQNNKKVYFSVIIGLLVLIGLIIIGFNIEATCNSLSVFFGSFGDGEGMSTELIITNIIGLDFLILGIYGCVTMYKNKEINQRYFVVGFGVMTVLKSLYFLGNYFKDIAKGNGANNYLLYNGLLFLSFTAILIVCFLYISKKKEN